jgi:hypothetical protein
LAPLPIDAARRAKCDPVIILPGRAFAFQQDR